MKSFTETVICVEWRLPDSLIGYDSFLALAAWVRCTCLAFACGWGWLKYSWWWMEIYSLGHHEGSGTAWTLSVLVLAGLNWKFCANSVRIVLLNWKLRKIAALTHMHGKMWFDVTIEEWLFVNLNRPGCKNT